MEEGEVCMKRILVLLSVVAMMVVMLAMSVAPAFAAFGPLIRCTDPTGQLDPVYIDTFMAYKHAAKSLGYTDCVRL